MFEVGDFVTWKDDIRSGREYGVVVEWRGSLALHPEAVRVEWKDRYESSWSGNLRFLTPLEMLKIRVSECLK